MTSLARLLPAAPALEEVAGRVAANLAATLGLRPRLPDEPTKRLSCTGWEIPEGGPP